MPWLEKLKKRGSYQPIDPLEEWEEELHRELQQIKNIGETRAGTIIDALRERNARNRHHANAIIQKSLKNGDPLTDKRTHFALDAEFKYEPPPQSREPKKQRGLKSEPKPGRYAAGLTAEERLEIREKTAISKIRREKNGTGIGRMEEDAGITNIKENVVVEEPVDVEKTTEKETPAPAQPKSNTAENAAASESSEQEKLAKARRKQLGRQQLWGAAKFGAGATKAAMGPGGCNFLLLFAFIIWIWDYRTGYLGVTEVAIRFLDFKNIGAASLFLIVMALHIAGKWTDRNPKEWVTYAITVSTIIFVVFTGSFTKTGFLHFIFILMLWSSVIKDKKPDYIADIYLALLIIVDFYRYPILQFFNLPMTIVALIMALPFLLLFTIIYFKGNFPGNKFTTFAFWVTFIIIVSLNWEAIMVSSQAIVGVEEGISVKSPMEVFKESWGGVKGFFGDMRVAYEKQLEYATGGYYTSKVEKYEDPNSKLGVYLEDIETAARHFYEDEEVVLWGNLKARTLDEPINVYMSCKTGEDKLREMGTIIPETLGDKKDQYEIYQYEEIGFECRFKPGQLGPGNNIIKINVEFNFETLAFLKTYFMDIERIRALRKENIDPLKQYGIKDKDIKGVSTYGPVKLGMGTTDPPIGLKTDNDGYTFLGITLENQWPHGRIKNITNITIDVPEKLSLKESDNYKDLYCSRDSFEKSESKEKEGYATYRMTDDEISRSTKTPITSYKSWRCSITVDGGNVGDILGNTPVATHYYRANAAYIYEIQKSTTVYLKSVPGKPTRLKSCTTQCKDSDGCVCAISGCHVDEGSEIEKGDTCTRALTPENILLNLDQRMGEIEKAEARLAILIIINDLCLSKDDNLDNKIEELELEEKQEQDLKSLVKGCKDDPYEFLSLTEKTMLEEVQRGVGHFGGIEDEKFRFEWETKDNKKMVLDKAKDFRGILSSVNQTFWKILIDERIEVRDSLEKRRELITAIEKMNALHKSLEVKSKEKI